MGNWWSTPGEKPVVGDVVGQDDIKRAIENIISQHNVTEAQVKVREYLNRWRHIPVNICIVGERGCGKSTLINNMSGANLAEVGVRETTGITGVIRSYPHPANPRLLFWDLPGYGARLYPTVAEYITAMDMNRFDIILFLHKDSFMAMDGELCEAIKRVGKPFFIVRSRFDIDMQPGNGTEEDVKNSIESEIRSYQINDRCYFISHPPAAPLQIFDNEVLMEDIFNAFDDVARQEAFVFSVGNINSTMLRIKRAQLQRRIYFVAMLAAAVNVVSGPNTHILFNNLVLVEETVFMANVLGIIRYHGQTYTECFNEFRELYTEVQWNNLLREVEMNPEVWEIIPVIGFMISCQRAFQMAYTVLTRILEILLRMAENNMANAV